MSAGSMAESLPWASDVERHYSLFGVGPAHPLSFDEGVHCACDRCSTWDKFVRTGGSHGQPQYLIPTRSLVHGLATWLISEQAAARVTPLRVLEVGAGDGALARSLRATLAAAGADVLVIASDSYDRGLRAVPGMDVFCADVDTALAAFAPVHVVLCAFMPLGHDWTAAFRRTASIRAYILLGEVDQGCCGRPWATWGYLCDDDGAPARTCHVIVSHASLASIASLSCHLIPSTPSPPHIHACSIPACLPRLTSTRAPPLSVGSRDPVQLTLIWIWSRTRQVGRLRRTPTRCRTRLRWRTRLTFQCHPAPSGSAQPPRAAPARR